MRPFLQQRQGQRDIILRLCSRSAAHAQANQSRGYINMVPRGEDDGDVGQRWLLGICRLCNISDSGAATLSAHVK